MIPEPATEAAQLMHENWHYLAIAGILVAAVAVMRLLWDDY